MLPTAVPQQELHEVIMELQQLLHDVKTCKAGNNELVLDRLYKLKAKATEAIELLREQDAPAAVQPATYQKKLHRLYQRL